MREAPISTGKTERVQLRQAVKQLPVVVRLLHESESGIENDLRRVDTRGDGDVDLGEQLVAHLGHHVVVVRGPTRVDEPTGRTASA